MKFAIILSLFVSAGAMAQTSGSYYITYSASGVPQQVIRSSLQNLQNRIDAGESLESISDLSVYLPCGHDHDVNVGNARIALYELGRVKLQEKYASAPTTAGVRTVEVYSDGSNPDVNGKGPKGVRTVKETDPAYSGQPSSVWDYRDEKAHTVGPSTNSQ